MRVAIVQQHVDPQRGGAETSTVEMARALAAAGLHVTVLYMGSETGPFLSDNVRYWPLPVTARTRLGRAFRFLQAVSAACRATPFEIVHAVTPSLRADVYQPRGGTYAETVTRTLAPVRPALWRAVKHLGRRFNMSQRFYWRIEELLLAGRRTRVHVAALSEYVRRQILNGREFPPEHVTVVFNGVDCTPPEPQERGRLRRTARAELQLEDDTPLLLFAAHNFKLKGLGELLAALPHAPGYLLVAGRDDPVVYRRRAVALGIADRVRFVGTTTPMRTWYAATDALVQPTWYDPCSRTVLEALCYGLPTVTTQFNGAAEALTPATGRIVATPADRLALAAALTDVLRPEMRAGARDAAPHYQRDLSMTRHARELIALYERIVRSRPHPVARSIEE
ncbi:MAG: glycosyltransferase family 4 protein [Phycisphaerales bacterium]|nr:glycosyltransferase family 4 protein [Phycisphaerales bacterium]